MGAIIGFWVCVSIATVCLAMLVAATFVVVDSFLYPDPWGAAFLTRVVGLLLAFASLAGLVGFSILAYLSRAIV